MELKQTLDLPTLFHAVNATRTAQLAYGRAYFELRDESTDTTEALALLQLLYGSIQATLEYKLQLAGAQPPEPDEHCGPFASDPRSSIFDIDAHLTRSYLTECDQAIIHFYTQNKEALGLKAEELSKWIQELESHRRHIATSEQLDATTTNRETDTNARTTVPFAQCG